MDDVAHKLSRTIWIGVALLIVILCISFVLSRIEPKRRPVAAPVMGHVANFTLTNQEARAVTLADLRGHVWVADIIFTRCAGPCPRMTGQMKELEKALPADGDTKLVTLTTDPDYDTPTVLKTYSERFGADLNRWMFLTGTKEQIRKLGIDSLKLTAVEKKPEEREEANDLFIHSTIFVL